MQTDSSVSRILCCNLTSLSIWLRLQWATRWECRCYVSAWLPAWLPVVVTLSICSNSTISKSASSSQNQKKLALFRATHILPEKTKFETVKTKKNNFAKAVKQHYIGEVGKPITFVLHILSTYSMANIVEIQQMWTLQ